ncbi:MAG: DUF29 domain-containing protein [Geitlerinemataceae cyanobacterium]
MPQKAASQISANALYDRDYVLWVERTVADLRAGNLQNLDLENLIEEIEDMGSSQKHALIGNMQIVLMHLLKYASQPEKRSNSWRFTLVEHRDRLQRAVKASPSLKRYASENLDGCYKKAVRFASEEKGLPRSTFPPQNPFTLEEVFDSDYLPE